MTPRNQELYDNFQLFYDNLSSHQAPGLTYQEVSTYLSDAQNVLVQTFYREYEKDEAARKALVPLVATALLSPASGVLIKKATAESVFYQLPVVTSDTGTSMSDVLYVLYEALRKSAASDRCPQNNDILIQPILHDELHDVYRNPFRYNRRRALRLDVHDGANAYAEIVSKTSGSYYVRYIKRPTPIILTANEYTIDGYRSEHEPVLDPIFDNSIVEAAATKAYQHYKA